MTSGRWAEGYTLAELNSAQPKFGLVFPPDLVARSSVKSRAVSLLGKSPRLVLWLALMLACSLRVLDALLLG
jgi:hypothetical protein